VIGRKGAEIEKMTEEISKMADGKQVKIDIQEIKTPEIDAQLVAENVALQIERRIAYRRAMKKAVQTAMDFGAEGIKLRSSGRLNGAEISRSEWYREGKIPLHTLRTPIDYGFAEANTVYGKIGVKCWICRKEDGQPNRPLLLPRRHRRHPSQLKFRRTLYAIDAKTCEVSESPAREPQGDCFAQSQDRFWRVWFADTRRAWITNTQLEAARVALLAT
jgi:ribosomal protein S3, bacterial type